MIAKKNQVVVSDPEVLGGTPVFAGTRVPVDTLFAHVKAGDTIDTFLEDFPSVSRAQIEALLDLTAELMVENGRNAHSAR
jgi:uncharacterized protein (DUF433 family)